MERLSIRQVALILAIGALSAALVWVVPEVRLHSLARVALFAGAAMALNLLIGNAGLISTCQGMFLGVGAYTVAIANIKYDLSFAEGALLAVPIAIVVACFVGAVALRARSLFFALLTLAIAQVFYVLAARNYDLTGGDDGLVGILVPQWLESDAAQYLLVVCSTTAICLVLLVLLASPFGATLRAVRDNADRVASLGGNPKLYEFSAFVITGVIGALLGIVAAAINRSVDPHIISWTTGTELLVMVALGGRSTFLGPIAGAVLLELARSNIQRYSDHADLAVGLIVIGCAILLPEGIGASVRSFFAKFQASRRLASNEVRA
ncbi:hypothetical protein GG851_08200 [Bordetella petrii]|nr:hypothetical protein [Bordetella petrii]